MIAKLIIIANHRNQKENASPKSRDILNGFLVTNGGTDLKKGEGGFPVTKWTINALEQGCHAPGSQTSLTST